MPGPFLFLINKFTLTWPLYKHPQAISFFTCSFLASTRSVVLNTGYLSKIGLCEIEINGSKVEVYVADNSALVVAMINDLKYSSRERRVVGLDYKNTPTVKVLILCIGADCLIIKLICLDSVPKTLKQFLADETYCFLGKGMSNIVQALQSDDMQCGRGIDVGYLFARILRKPNIEGYGLKD